MQRKSTRNRVLIILFSAAFAAIAAPQLMLLVHTFAKSEINADGPDQSRPTADAGANLAVGTEFTNPLQEQLVSPTGKIVFASTRDGSFSGDAEIYVMNPDGSNQTRITDNAPADDFNPNFSTDGTRITFTSNRDAFNPEIYVMNSDGTGQTRLTNNPAEDYEPSFSPDGTRIVFASNRVPFNRDIYVMDADGSNQTRLTTNAATDGQPSFSPDGTRITFISVRDGNFEIYVMNADGSGQTRLTNNTVFDGDPRFSPDGTRIVFSSARDGNNEIYVMDANGTNPRRLTNNTASDVNPTFSPAGTEIAFMSERDGNPEIYMMNVDGSGQTRLTNDPLTDKSPSWSVGIVPVPTPTPPPTTRIVTKTADTNDGVCDADCSLREGMAIARSGDTIEFASPLFDSPQTITLTPTGMGGLGGLSTYRNITINGKGAHLLTIGRPGQADHSYANRMTIFSFGSRVTANLSGMRVSGGVTGGSGGGIITSSVGSLTTINNCHVTGNFAGSAGGGIRNDSRLTIINSTISNNESSAGGGIFSTGPLIITNSTISGNRGSDGGGIFHFGGTSVFTNSTITDNAATVTSRASGISRSYGSITLRNTIVAGNRNNATTPEVTGVSGSGNDRYVSGGYNLIGNAGNVTDFNQPGDQSGVTTPMLAALSLNGGTTLTHALLPGSPAIDKGKGFGLTTDQRGLMRPVDNPSIPPAPGGDNSDIGAFEVQPEVTPAVTVSGRVTTPDGRGLRNAIVKLTDSNNVLRTVTTSSFGYYSFDNVATGQSYTIAISSRLYRFQPRVVQVTGELTNVDFVGLE